MVYGGRRHAVKMGNKSSRKQNRGKDEPGGASQSKGAKTKTKYNKYKQEQLKKRRKVSSNFNRKEKQEEDMEVEEVNSNYISKTDDNDADQDGSDLEEEHTRKLVSDVNRKNKKGGGFQSMGLSHAVYKGLSKKGYKLPTPIQRKTMPIIMEGRDVVAMARTGSGKTAAFLLPMFERLKAHSTTGARALILSPTRELAMQTLKFTKELGRFTGLRCAVILGGDSMEDQFSSIHEQPDILVATPGRFMHLCIEMELKLNAVEYVVFDEADRLFELGFKEQLHNIMSRLPDGRQTLLFSATLPGLLVEFARAGLHDPTLIRLDVESKLSENLKTAFITCRSEDKVAVLLHLLRCVMNPAEQTVVFASTKHHVEYLNLIMCAAGVSCTYIYSSLDQTARKINVAKFRNKSAKVLVVTDLAARGIDIPLLDNVINFSFPAKPKLFVHRVGRVARAGRSGSAYSLICADELPFMVDLMLFLGRSLRYADANSTIEEDSLIGNLPQDLIDTQDQDLREWHKQHDIESQAKVVSNAQKQYLKSRPNASSESIRRAKELGAYVVVPHPIFGQSNKNENARNNLLASLKNFKPNTTIFEINSTSRNSASSVMRGQRAMHGKIIAANQSKLGKIMPEVQKQSANRCSVAAENATDDAVSQTFSRIVAPKYNSNKLSSTKGRIDAENFVRYRRPDHCTEKGLSLGSNFEQDASNAAMEITNDDNALGKKMNNQMKWDRKRKKFVGDKGNEPGKKKIRTESGTLVKSSFKTNAYRDWLEKSKMADRQDADGDDDDKGGKRRFASHKMRRKMKRQTKLGGDEAAKGKRNELKSKEQILKGRRQKAQKQSQERQRTRKHAKGR